MNQSKHRIRLGLLIFTGIAFLTVGVLSIALWVTTRGGSAVPTAVTTTQDGQQWTLSTQLFPNGMRIAVITDTTSQFVFAGSMRFSDYSRWFVYGSAGEFWIYSGDIGILHYSRESGGQWSEQSGNARPATTKVPRAFYSQLPDSTRKHIDLNSVGP